MIRQDGTLARKGPVPRSFKERLLAKTDRTGGCWVYQGSPGAGDRYVRIGIGTPRRMEWAHRAAYELWHGPIPSGMHVDHTCFNRRCVHPDHLRVLTPSENSSRQRRHLNPLCKRGHNREGRRDCRQCHALREQAAYRRRQRPSRLS